MAQVTNRKIAQFSIQKQLKNYRNRIVYKRIKSPEVDKIWSKH